MAEDTRARVAALLASPPSDAVDMDVVVGSAMEAIDSGYEMVPLGDLARVAAKELRVPALGWRKTSGCCSRDSLASCTCVFASEPAHVLVAPKGSANTLILGYLESRHNQLCLQDASARVRVTLANLDPNALGQCLLVTAWTYVHTSLQGHLDIASYTVVPRQAPPAWQTPHFDWDALFHRCYPRQMPPTYGGPATLATALAATSELGTKGRSYIVRGRLRAFSPVLKSYFFAEIDCTHVGARQSASVLVTGDAVRAHPCLVPGMDLVITDTIKIFAKEHGIYMLQTTPKSVVWRVPPIPTSLPPLDVATDVLDTDVGSSIHVRGVITRYLGPDTLELNHRWILQCMHFPPTCALRVGTTVVVYNAPVTAPGTLGLCARSTLIVDGISVASTRLLQPTIHLKKSSLALHQLPLPTVAALTQLVTQLLDKFGGRGAASETVPPAWHLLALAKGDYAVWRKRELLRAIAARQGIEWTAALPTLAASFLQHEIDCFSSRAPTRPLRTAISIAHLIEVALAAKVDALSSDVDDILAPFLVLGCVIGCAATASCALADRTGSIPLVLLQSSHPTHVSAATLYELRKYQLCVHQVGGGGAGTPGLFVRDDVTYAVHLAVAVEDLLPVTPQDDKDNEHAPMPSPLLLVVEHVHVHDAGHLVHGIDVTTPSHPRMVDVLVPKLPWYLGARGAVWQLDRSTLTKSRDVTFTPPAARGTFDLHRLIAQLPSYLVGLADDDALAVDAVLAALAKRPNEVLTLVTYHASPFTWIQGVRIEPDAPMATAKPDTTCPSTLTVATTVLPARQWREIQLLQGILTSLEPLRHPKDVCVVPLVHQSSSAPVTELLALPSVHKDVLVSLVGRVVSVRMTYHKDVLRGLDDALIRVHLQDLTSRDLVDITWNVGRYAYPSGLSPGAVVTFHRIKMHIRRLSFKPYFAMMHTTRAVVVHSTEVPSSPPPVPRKLLLELYQVAVADRRYYEHIGTVCHLSYATLKLQCARCQRVVVRDSHGSLRHAQEDLAPCPSIVRDVVVLCSVRCLVDDGTAQVEVYASGDVAWDLLHVSGASRAQHEATAVALGTELAYFSNNAPGIFDAPSPQMQFHIDAWRASILNAASRRTQIVLHAKRFYAKLKPAPDLSVLRCGEFQLRTPVQPMVQLEAIAVHDLHVRYEWWSIQQDLQALQIAF